VLLQTATVSSQLSPEEVKTALNRASKLVGKKVVFSVDRITETVNDQKMISLLKLPEGISDTGTSELAATWNKEINREPRNAVLEYDKNTLKVSNFVPPQNGLTVHQDDLKQLLSSTLAELETSTETQKTVSIPVKETAPEITLDKTNDLGINQQIGFGDSQYFHSIPGRIHNVDLTASRVNNVIVKAGEEFSFNKTLGEVSAATGFAPAYVIKNGKTELGDGGGVCQVSTTVFRAVLNAGLKVTKRIPHSYRVSYYELNSKPGIDATVYAGDVDLRFINDTGHDILIHTENNPKALYLAVEIFGTSDGRTTQIVDHKTWDAVPAPAPRYQDDPTLPKGTTKQVDFAAGGIKSSFTNVIKDKDGKELRRDTYFSNYKAWQAVFLVGTG
jgi:vancomycin resistance protein YoaR